MTKLLGFIVSVLISIMFGFWLAATNILDGTQVGQLLYDVVDMIPVPNEFSSGMQVGLPEEETNSNSKTEQQQETAIENSSAEIDYKIIENRIFELLNELRTEVGVQPVTKNQPLKLAADQRALETEELFEHTRPDGSDPFTVLEETGHEYRYQLAGENLAMATYYLDELGMADVIFDGWKNSEGHYENMVKPEFEEVGIGIHYDGEVLYATQIFGTPR